MATTPNRIQSLRSSTPGQRPPNTRSPGEIYTNWADRQIGVMDSASSPMDLVGVRFFSTAANYAIGDHVIQAGALYRALVAANAGPFDPAKWAQISASVSVGDAPPSNPQDGNLWWDSVGGEMYVYYTDANSSQWVSASNVAGAYLPIGGGTLTGPAHGVTPAANDSSTLFATTAYVQGSLGGYLPLAGGTLTGQLNGTIGNFSGNVSGANWVGAGVLYPNYNANNTARLSGGAGDCTIYWNNNNYVSAQANIVYLTAAGVSCSWNGSIFTAAALSASGNIAANGSVYPIAAATGSAMYLGGTATQRILQWTSNWFVQWRSSDGLMTFNSPTGAVHQWDGSGNYTLGASGNGFKAGGGPWAAVCDDRTKQDIGPYTSGLTEILQLEPIAFHYNGEGGTSDDGKTYYGVSAQATQPIMPELIIDMDPVRYDLEGNPLPRPDHVLPGQLGTDLGPLTLALVNAVKTLTARIEALEAAGAR